MAGDIQEQQGMAPVSKEMKMAKQKLDTAALAILAEDADVLGYDLREMNKTARESLTTDIENAAIFARSFATLAAEAASLSASLLINHEAHEDRRALIRKIEAESNA